MISGKVIFKRIYNYLLYSNFNIREINLENDRKYLDILEKKYRKKINYKFYFFNSNSIISLNYNIQFIIIIIK